MNLHSALSCCTSKALRYGPCVTRGSHSFTCHPHTNHICLYSPATRRHRQLAGTHCAYPLRDGQAEFTWVAEIDPVHRELNPDTVTHPSTNRARRRLTSLIETNALLLRQTTNQVQVLRSPSVNDQQRYLIITPSRKLHGSMFYTTGVIADRRFTLQE